MTRGKAGGLLAGGRIGAVLRMSFAHLHRREGVEEVRQERGAIAEGTGNHIVTPISVRRRWLGTNRVRDQPAGARLQKGRPLTHR
jgi:hypothetical protein